MKIEVDGHDVYVDDEDAWRLLSEPWAVQTKLTAHRSYSYVRKDARIDGRATARLLHREVVGARKGELVDHVNGNSLDNRKANLRVCTHGENMRNRQMHANNRSGVKGVFWCKDKLKFRAQVRLNGKKYHAGYARTAIEAGRMYDKKARELHGEFARGNATEAVTV
jgi:hypothetical protein